MAFARTSKPTASAGPFVGGLADGPAVESGAGSPARERSVKSVDHALDILEFLTTEHGTIGVTQLAKHLGMNASTVHHILKTLEARRFVEQHPVSKLYRLGVRSLHVGQAYLAGLDVYTAALPHLTEVGRECGETVALAAIDGQRIAHLTTIPGRHVLRSEGEPVNRFNAHATALGKVLLAALSSEDRDRLITQAGLARYTAHTICSFRQLESELARVRDQGYALDLEESEIGLCCVSAPIHNHLGVVHAAIAVSVPRARFDDERRPILIELVKAAARRIAVRLGHEP